MMADVIILFAAALLVLGGIYACALILAAQRKARIKLARKARELRRRLRPEPDDTDDFIGQVNQALTEDQLDSLVREREEKKREG